MQRFHDIGRVCARGEKLRSTVTRLWFSKIIYRTFDLFMFHAIYDKSELLSEKKGADL